MVQEGTQIEAADIGLEPAAKKQKTCAVVAKQGITQSNKISKKDIDAKLKHASPEELKTFFKSLATSHPDVFAEIFPSFLPAKMPAVPTADDPILKRCFHCESQGDLNDFHGVKVCSICNADIHECDSLSKQKVMRYFNFSDHEAEKIPHKKGFGMVSSFFRRRGPVIGLIYKHSTVIKAVEKKHGSLYSMVLKEKEPYGHFFSLRI